VTASSGETAATVDDAVETIRASGGRATSAKRLLIEILAANPGHRSADELTSLAQARSPDLAASTVYRILDELERLGLVEHSHDGKGPATYHLRTAAHGHLVCQDCGLMIEAAPALFDQLVSRAQRRYGFAVDPHHFAVLGRCADCASRS